MSEERIITIDANCVCGATLLGAWSGDEVDHWQEHHDHDEDEAVSDE